MIAGRRAPARALDTAMDELDARLHRIGQHPFRAKFRLRGRDRAVVDLRGITTIRRYAEELVGGTGWSRPSRSTAAVRCPTVGIRCSSRSMPPRHAAASAWRAGTTSPRGRTRRRRARLCRGGDLSGGSRSSTPPTVRRRGRIGAPPRANGPRWRGNNLARHPRAPTTRTDLDFGTVTMSATGSTVGVFAALSAQSRDGVPALRRPGPPESAAPDVGWEQRGRRRSDCAVLVWLAVGLRHLAAGLCRPEFDPSPSCPLSARHC